MSSARNEIDFINFNLSREKKLDEQEHITNQFNLKDSLELEKANDNDVDWDVETDEFGQAIY